ncbi:MAG TPA: hypothetical protein VN426_06440 [Syntrophomonadaceae bacterium]|nr:hypothetical protein [Syntrophomonadaceae bacterium]
MSYYVIDGTPVFLTWAKYYQLREEIMSRFEIPDDCFYGIHGRNSEEANLVTSAIKDLLANKKRSNEERFYIDWVSFDMDKAEASDNVWELLYDYSVLTRNSAVRSIRDDQTFAHGVDPDTYGYSMGRLIALDFMAQKSRIARWLLGQKRMGTLMIDSDKVTKIQGTLDDFIMIYNDKEMRFASVIELADSLIQESY